VIVIEAGAATVDVVTPNVALAAPAATVTLAGTDAETWLLVSVTTAPPDGAVALKVTVPAAEAPPVTLVGLTARVASDGAAGVDWGVKLRTTDHAPAVPAEFRPRTRHQCWRAASEAAVNWDADTL
jgi:hypothetical protein